MSEETKDEIVTLIKPYADQKDVTYLCAEAGPIRLIEGKARVPLSVARKIVEGRRGWLVEPAVYVRTPSRVLINKLLEQRQIPPRALVKRIGLTSRKGLARHRDVCLKAEQDEKEE